MSPPPFRRQHNEDRRQDQRRREDPRRNNYQKSSSSFYQRRSNSPPPVENHQKVRENNPAPTNPFHAKLHSNAQTRPANNLISQRNDPRFPKVGITNHQVSKLNQPQNSNPGKDVKNLLSAFSIPHNNQVLPDPSFLRNFSPQNALSPSLEQQPSAPISTFHHNQMNTPPTQQTKIELMLKDRVDQLTRENREKDRNNGDLVQEKTFLINNMAQKDDRIKRLEEELQRVNHEKIEMERNHKKEINEKSLRKNALVEQYEELKKKYKEQSERLEKLKSQQKDDVLQAPGAKRARKESVDQSASNDREDLLKQMLQERVDELEHLVNSKNDEIKRLKDANTSKSSKCTNSDCQSKLIDLDKSKKELITNHNKDITKLLYDLKKIRSDHSSTSGLLAKTKKEFEEQKEKYEHELDSKEKQIDEYVEKHNTLVSNYNKLLNTVANLEEENKRMNDMNIEISNEKDKYKKTQHDLYSQFNKIQKQLDEVKAKSDSEYEKLVEESNRRLENGRLKFENQVRENARLKSQLDENLSSISDLENEIVDLKQNIVNLERERCTNSSQMSQMIKSYQEVIQRLEAKLLDNANKSKTKEDELLATNKTLNEIRCIMAAKITELNAEAMELKKEVDSERMEIAKRDQIIKEKTNQLHYLQQQLNTKFQECDSWRKKYYSSHQT